MWTFGLPPWELAFRSALIYLAMVVVLRIFGKREVGQFTLFDLVLILLVARGGVTTISLHRQSTGSPPR